MNASNQLNITYSTIMSQNMKSVYRIFYIIGISFDPPSRKKSLRQNLWSFWSVVMISFHFVATIASLYQIKLITDATKPFFTIFVFICLCSLSMLFYAVKFLKYEKNFWNLIRQSERMFMNHFGEKPNYDELKRYTRRKLFKSLAFFLFCQMSTIGHGWFYSNILLVKTSAAILFPISVMRLSAMKYTFYVDVLHFRLNQIRLVLKRKTISLNNVRSLEKAYELCFRLNEQIEEIFARTMIYNLFLTFVGVLYSTNNILIAATNNKLNISPCFMIMSIAYVVFVLYNTCKKCSDCASTIAPLILSRNCSESNNVVETFALQLLHQRNIFRPKGLFSINHKGLMSVS